MKTVGNSQYQKLANTYLILKQLRSGDYSRTELSQLLGLQASTVTNVTARLLDLGMVEESADESASGLGRKRTLLSLRGDTGLAAGLELLVGCYRLVLTDLKGQVLAEEELLYTDNGLPFLKKVREALSSVEARASGHRLLGACIAVPGVVYPDRYYVEECWTHGLYKADLRSDLWSYPYPVFLENDANASAFSFLSRGRENEVYLYLLLRRHDLVDLPSGEVPLIGIGSGIVINGELYRGEHGHAGEFRSSGVSAPHQQVSLTNEELGKLGEEEGLLRRFLEEILDVYLVSSCLLDPSRLYIGGFVAEEPFCAVLEDLLDSSYRDKLKKLLPGMEVVISRDSRFDPSRGSARLFLDWLLKIPRIGVEEEDERRFSILETGTRRNND